MLKSWITISLAVISCAIHNEIEAVRNRPFKIVKRAAQILDRRYSNPEKQQRKLIQDLKNNAGHQIINPANFNLIVTALAYKNTIVPIARNRQILEQSHELFHDVPGYQELVERMIKHTEPNEEANFRGALFELQKAIEIEEADSGEYVEAFNKKIRDEETNRIVREIDIVTNRRWIECKDIRTQGKKLGVYKTQIANQQELALVHNLVYEVHFKSAVSETFLNWLRGQGITYVCPPKN